MGATKHTHDQIRVVTYDADTGEQLGEAVFSRADVEAQQMSELPDREAMSLVTANVAAPINLALAANVLSDGSIAYANATQYAPITQTT
ncbi:MAG TPA: hypothetical protein VF134_01415 [Candidatus Dormibacteraeota bacterium]